MLEDLGKQRLSCSFAVEQYASLYASNKDRHINQNDSIVDKHSLFYPGQFFYESTLLQVLIDNEEVSSGDLEKDWNFLPPKMITDPSQSKPEDWDDKPTIDDPEDKKPEDWDKPEHIPDPEASKPDDWDDEMDGEWEAPMIDNPDYKVRVH